MIRTKGDVVVDQIKIGDIHYEYEYGYLIKSEVVSLPQSVERKDDVYWTWKAKNVLTGKGITYGVSDKQAHYGPNIYTYPAYKHKYQV